MEFSTVLGVDMSKEWFNCCIMNAKFEIIQENQVENSPEAIFKFLAELLASEAAKSLKDTLLCLEYTGIYVQHLVRCYLSKGGQVCIVPATKVSKSLNGQFKWEEKTDSMDARRLAEYAFRFADKLKIWEIPDPTLTKLQCFQRQRDRLINAINILQVPVNESKQFDSIDISEALAFNQAASIKALGQDLKELEKSINQLIESDEYLAQLFKLITSVEGVGAVTAREIIIATEGFTKFQSHQGKAFARYAGVIPLKHESGKYARRHNKIANRVNVRLKTLLTMGAHALINKNLELGLYYQRKMAEGKHHMTVINAMRNKMILRVFAVVRNQVTYQKNLNISLD
nr:IS110 family transposase [Nitrosomonas nitrosa]